MRRLLWQDECVPILEPSVALSTCETALRELMTHSYRESYGAGWLERISTLAQRQTWADRAKAEEHVRVPKGVAQVPNAGLAYANFYDLVQIAKTYWEPLSGALGKLKTVLPLLERFDNLRNTIGHSRPLLAFEQDLMSGIAGQVRNQVTLYMSAQDDAGDIYPRIESITDSFGRRIESSVVDGEVAGSVTTYDIDVRPGDVISFTCVGVDPQGRDLRWDLITPKHGAGANAVGKSGQVTNLVWLVDDGDVTETAHVSIHMQAHDARYRRYGNFDHRAYFAYRVRPPL